MPEHEYDEDLDEVIKYSLKFYSDHYDMQSWMVGRGLDRTVLGNRYQRQCRFCRRSVPDVSFRNEAHAIPESFGNNNLFVTYECDECNQSFGDSIENDFGNWFLPMRTLAGIRGKKGYPSIKVGKGRIDSRIDGLNVDHEAEADLFIADELNNTITMNIIRPPYRPLNVMKSFVKMGLSLVDEDRIGFFENTLGWLNNSHPSYAPIRLWSLQSYTIPGPGRSPVVFVSMLYRKSYESKLPYAMLFISYEMQSFQVIIPSLNETLGMGDGSFEMPLLAFFSLDSIK